MQDLIRQLLAELGEDPTREGLLRTPLRVEKALRFLIDEVGVDRVVLGSDWPFVPWHPSPVTWVQGLVSLTAEEKERILWRNLEALLGLKP